MKVTYPTGHTVEEFEAGKRYVVELGDAQYGVTIHRRTDKCVFIDDGKGNIVPRRITLNKHGNVEGFKPVKGSRLTVRATDGQND